MMRKLIEPLNRPNGKKDKAAIKSLRDEIGDRACLMLDGNGKLDAALTEKCRDFLDDLGELRAASGHYKDAKTIDEWLAAGKAALRCDPSVGILDGRAAVALDHDGISQDAAEISYAGVLTTVDGKGEIVPRADADERMQYILLARRTDRVTRHPMPGERRQWAKELSADTLQADPWPAVAAAHAKLTATQKEALADALVWRKPGSGVGPLGGDPAGRIDVTEQVMEDRRRLREQGGGSSVHIGGDVHGSVVVTGNGNAVGTPQSSGAPQVFAIADQVDRKHYDALAQSMRGSIRAGMLSLSSVFDCPPGAVHTSWMAARMAEARVILVLLSADSSDSHLIQMATMTSARIIPILVRPCIVPHVLATKQVLPMDGRFVTQWPDKDSAWLAVAEGVRNAVMAGGR